ncbi:MAG: nucleotide exchange factor GrpE [Candidatus Liptonbacteria bacterium RIFCSPLOWO2_01_FULL_45_15]|uniref:Protein GrpE n=1 Tax=Candidatus Liptonbacteria bacterium RIFCSPLOWO2_01_FULL_45_15 TaxID=1798649 RepID=A0A1G2CIG3_9BACT|nr:MAG: nucleotide exchange factor GrpE [Candidatus Liptonbacteria bacterium RIFCSPLOWO2_01_FULL_45_15]
MDEIKQNGEEKNAPTPAQKTELTVEEKLAEAEKQRDEYLAGWQRAKADFLNYKKDEGKRFEDLIRFANEDILEELIGVLDSFDLGLAALEKAGPVEKGVYMVRSKLDNVLKQRGLEILSVKIGDKFDPSLSEAMVEIESEQPVGTILEIIESGYKLRDKILRPARVKVSKGKG